MILKQVIIKIKYWNDKFQIKIKTKINEIICFYNNSENNVKGYINNDILSFLFFI